MIRRPRTRVDADVPYLPALLLLFVGSGCAALIYQIVWLQLLELVIGSSAISVGVLLGTFMGGMCLGSYVQPRAVRRDLHPLRVYAYLELGIGIAGLLLLYGMPFVNHGYVVTGGGVMVRAAVAALCLLPPTMMMGATLPAVARWVEASPAGVSWLGFFYGGNIAGAVAGTLLAGFYLLRVYDMAVATWVALALNVGVAIVAFALASRTPYRPVVPETDRPAATGRVAASRSIYVAIALSGLTALACEVLWTRLLALAVGATVYAFSLILASFLFSLGVGTSLGAVLARRSRDPRVTLGWCQMLLCAAMAWAGYRLTEVLPLVPILESADPRVGLIGDLGRCSEAPCSTCSATTSTRASPTGQRSTALPTNPTSSSGCSPTPRTTASGRGRNTRRCCSPRSRANPKCSRSMPGRWRPRSRPRAVRIRRSSRSCFAWTRFRRVRRRSSISSCATWSISACS